MRGVVREERSGECEEWNMRGVVQEERSGACEEWNKRGGEHGRSRARE